MQIPFFSFWGNEKLTGSPKGPWIFARLQRCAVYSGNILNSKKKSLTGKYVRIEPDIQQKKNPEFWQNKEKKLLVGPVSLAAWSVKKSRR